MIGELYEDALAGRAQAEIEHADGSRMPLAVESWMHATPGDKSLVERCHGPTLDVGSGPGRLTVALAERGIPALGIDITPYAVHLAQSAGALALLRDVFGHVPGAGRWMTVLLADGNIGIGGDPAALLRRVGELLTPGGHALVEVQPPGEPLRRERVRLRKEGLTSSWFPWAFVGADQINDVARSVGLEPVETWTADGRWFASLGSQLSSSAARTAADEDEYVDVEEVTAAEVASGKITSGGVTGGEVAGVEVAGDDEISAGDAVTTEGATR